MVRNIRSARARTWQGSKEGRRSARSSSVSIHNRGRSGSWCCANRPWDRVDKYCRWAGRPSPCGKKRIVRRDASTQQCSWLFVIWHGQCVLGERRWVLWLKWSKQGRRRYASCQQQQKGPGCKLARVVGRVRAVPATEQIANPKHQLIYPCSWADQEAEATNIISVITASQLSPRKQSQAGDGLRDSCFCISLDFLLNCIRITYALSRLDSKTQSECEQNCIISHRNMI